MNYIYDIVLNFNKEYFEFFQWKKGDKIINIKKIPAFRVSAEDIRNFKYNKIKVSKDFLNKIFDLTLFYNKNDNYKYLCLVSSGSETLGVMFDKEGNLIKKSSLIFDEDDEVNDEVVNESVLNINYLENIYRDINYLSRTDKERRDYLLKFVNNLDLEKDYDILKYIYYDYFEKEENDVYKIKKYIILEINSNISDKNKLYDLVKIFKKIRN